jgi:hypothetical protein
MVILDYTETCQFPRQTKERTDLALESSAFEALRGLSASSVSSSGIRTDLRGTELRGAGVGEAVMGLVVEERSWTDKMSVKGERTCIPPLLIFAHCIRKVAVIVAIAIRLGVQSPLEYA